MPKSRDRQGKFPQNHVIHVVRFSDFKSVNSPQNGMLHVGALTASPPPRFTPSPWWVPGRVQKNSRFLSRFRDARPSRSSHRANCAN